MPLKLTLLLGGILAAISSSVFLPIEILGSSGKEHIAAAVEGSFYGVLDDTDDETDSDSLHGDIVTDSEERASHGDEQQLTAGYTQSTASTKSGRLSKLNRTHLSEGTTKGATKLRIVCGGNEQSSRG